MLDDFQVQGELPFEQEVSQPFADICFEVEGHQFLCHKVQIFQHLHNLDDLVFMSMCLGLPWFFSQYSVSPDLTIGKCVLKTIKKKKKLMKFYSFHCFYRDLFNGI